MEDPLYDSALRMMDIPASDSVTLELAAGQNGVSVYELSIHIMNDQFFLFDPSHMERIDELVFAGYEPVPANTGGRYFSSSLVRIGFAFIY